MKSGEKTFIEIQYFNSCPNSDEMISRVGKAIKQLDMEIEYKEILIESAEEAQKVKFRGSPTLLINGIDLENLPEPEMGNMSCRYYRDGLPGIETIKNIIQKSQT